MAQVTVELGTLLERTNFKLFDFDYQFDDPEMKAKIEQAVIDYYYFYEIGQETPEAFKYRFKTRWLRMIDYYNKLHNTTLLDYNPLSNYSISEAMEQLAKTTTQTDSTVDSTVDSTNDSETTGNTFTDSNTKNSDYPQQAIAGGDFLAGESNTLSNTESEGTSKTTGKVTDRGTTSSTGEGTTNTDYSKTIEGITGTTYPDLIAKHRESILRIPPMIIDELKPCFILVY